MTLPMNRYAKHSAPLLRSFIWTCLLVVFGAWGAHAQTEATISEVNNNPGKFRGQQVSVEGTVARHVDSGSDTETMNYILQNNSGQEIRAKTTEQPPETGGQYRVVGVVEISPFNRQPVLDEESRTQISSGSSPSTGSTSSQSLRQGFSTITVYLILGLGVLVVVILIYFAYASQDDEPVSEVSPSQNGTPDPQPATELSSTELAADEEEPADTGFPEPSGQRIKSESSSSQEPEAESEGPETLKFKAPPKTMKFVPGRLVIAAGPDQGKEFRIAGRPTPDGNVVTIGRAEVEGERAFAHIQLGDTYRTVSRMQAEIIQQDQTILLKNTSETNPTMVNGDQVPAGTTVELQDGDMIRMGELMLRYERD
ncbi:MAG: FHA domain-containing protein [Salinivenus sp.]